MLYLIPDMLPEVAKSVLHIVHPLLIKDPDFLYAVKQVKSESHQIAKAGETHLTDSRFNSFSMVMVHDVPANKLGDFLKRIKDPYSERFRKLKEDPNKHLVFLGNSVKLVCKEILTIPKDENSFVNISTIDTNYSNLEGFDLFSYHLDIGYDPKESPTVYLKRLGVLSQKFPIYLMGKQSIYSSDGYVRNGEMYRLFNSILSIIKTMDRIIGIEHLTPKKKVKPITAIYKEDEEV